MPGSPEYVKVGRLEDIEKRGFLKIRLFGRTVVVKYADQELIAMEVRSDFNDTLGQALPAEFHPESSDLLDPLLEPPKLNWARIKSYPIIIDDGDVLVELNPMGQDNIL